MNYFVNADKSLCNGCSLCEVICPQNCIKMEEDYMGFKYPVINKSECINCKKCEKYCSNEGLSFYKTGSAYAMVNKNETDLKVSSSGGMFIAIAKYVINKGGVVCGVRYDSDLNAVFDIAETIEDCYKFCGSKYVRADINRIYNRIVDYLKKGRLVFFCGTSCQASAVKNLSQSYENILIGDIICHSNPSPKVYRMYLKAMEKKGGAKLTDIAFRTKENGWKDKTTLLTFSNGNRIYDKTFFRAFDRELMSRNSCNNCLFARNDRVTDITIGDLWRGNEILKNTDLYYSDKGLSLALVNSEKGAKLFDVLKNNFIYERVDYEKSLSFNHNANVPESKYKKKFFSGIKKGKITEENIYEYLEKYTPPTFILRIKMFLGKIKRRIFHKVKEIDA